MKRSKPKHVDETLTATIRKAMAESGLSQYRLAKESGISSAAISRFVSNETTLTLASADKLCKLLGLKLVKEQPPE
jgi:ribosome-binding protein aMBF1 (putative translation factor)